MILVCIFEGLYALSLLSQGQNVWTQINFDSLFNIVKAYPKNQ